MASIKKSVKKTAKSLTKPYAEKVVLRSSDAEVKSPITAKKIDLKPASSMDELMSRKQDKISVPKRGSILKGIVTEISGRMLTVDIGAKTEGIVIEKEFEEARDYIKSLEIGNEIRVYVYSPENDRGQILLSVRSAAGDWQWKKLEEWMRTGKIIDVRGLEINKGGLVARIDSMGFMGFVPTSQLSSKLAVNLENLVNRVFPSKIIEVDRKSNRLIFSEKAVSEAGEIEAKKEILKKLKVGERIKGIVSGLTDFGAFIKIKVGDKEVEGLVHVSEIAWEKIDKPDKVLKQGQEVEVIITDVSPDSGRIGFSIRNALADPWDEVETKFPPGKKLEGTVVKIASFGAIVQLEPGVSGLLHISKIPTGKEPKAGDKIEVVIEDLDRGHRKLALGMFEETPMIYR
ncbi:S1 RNA-binding domain-containing protein [Candidatus Collierbacteria bacterium]|nr:S1 RNA-binding domain-containing protein [Candidatus Collierbacteria bacterium]